MDRGRQSPRVSLRIAIRQQNGLCPFLHVSDDVPVATTPTNSQDGGKLDGRRAALVIDGGTVSRLIPGDKCLLPWAVSSHAQVTSVFPPVPATLP